MRIRLWPRGLATRTAVVVLLGLALVQLAGLAIHGLDRIDLQRLGQARDAAERAVGVYRTYVTSPADARIALLAGFARSSDLTVEVAPFPVLGALSEMPLPISRVFRVHVNLVPLGLPQMRWRETRYFGGPPHGRATIAFMMPDAQWLLVSMPLSQPAPWHSPTFLGSFVLMTVVAAGLIVWAVRRLAAPVGTLAAQAEALGRDVNAPPLPENGPLEVARAARAFNAMAANIRRYVADRTELLTAIGHDLRTPITRLKLRAEFVEDAEQRAKIMADLEELEAMVAATLAFGRDVRATEPAVSVDLAELLRTILDETRDARPDLEERLTYDGPPHLPVRARSLALKRALTNLVGNAARYGGAARVRLTPSADGVVKVEIEDDGPGIPIEDLERVFEPFHRLESSRNRETGGTGLGLPIARNILRAHGGDVVLANRPGGGLRAAATLAV